jgi:hypothetical protein
MKYIRRHEYESVQLDEEWIILNTDDYTVTKLNEVGGFCWSLLSGSQTVDSLLQSLRQEYTSIDETVEQDLTDFLADMIQRGLVQHAV